LWNFIKQVRLALHEFLLFGGLPPTPEALSYRTPKKFYEIVKG